MSRRLIFPDRYLSGECNIGQREIHVRKKFLSLFLPLVFLLTIINFFLPQSIFVWSSLLFTSFCAIVLYKEIRSRFCVIFGFFNLYNFKELGNIEEAQKSQDRINDRKKVLQIVVGSLAVALIYTASVHYIAVIFLDA